jgi:protein-tyrosine phosphatase
MIDIHAHILYGLDDGPGNEETTLAMLRSAQTDGIDRIIATPHYIYGANRYDLEACRDRYCAVIELIKRNHIAVELYMGNELFLDEYLPDSIKTKQCHTLAGSDYVLVELPVMGFPKNTESILYRILGGGHIPVIAHVERYKEVQTDYDVLAQFLHMGCLAQINAASITGESGRKLQETARDILTGSMCHLVATDMHSDHGRTPRLADSYEIVKGWLGADRAAGIFEINAEAILNNGKIVV